MQALTLRLAMVSPAHAGIDPAPFVLRAARAGLPRSRGDRPYRRLVDEWAAGPRTYLGLGVNGFPNMFLVNGPGSPGPLANMVLTSEQHLDWIVDCIEYVDERGAVTIEADSDAVDAWVAELNERASTTLFPSANSSIVG